MGDELLVDRRGSITVITLNRPDARNALTPAMLAGLGAAVADADADPAVRAVVITGAGDKAFCSGLDLRGFAAGEPSTEGREAMAGFNRLLHGGFAVPLIGAANGTAVAGGFEVLLGCDLIVAADHAGFGLPEVKRGLFPGGNGTAVGTRVAMAVALEMLLTGDTIPAERAYQVGLVNAVVPAAEVLGTALGYAERIVANGPLSVAAVKELARLAVADPVRWESRLGDLQPQVFGSADAREGATAFVERRPPNWLGR